MEKISVIIPVYKVEKYLDECVESVIAQTYTDLEIILVDDGSPDKCPEMCDAWAERDSRIRVIHQENRGLSGARNSGLDIMTGKYVTFVDSDDALHPEACRIMYEALIRDGCDMAVGDYLAFSDAPVISDISDKDERSEAFEQNEYINKYMLNRPEAWGKLYKRQIFDGLRFKEGILYEDAQINPYVCLRADRVSMVDAQIYYYRRAAQHPSIMNSAFSKKKFVIIDIYLEQCGLYSRKKVYGRAEARAIERLLLIFVKGNIVCSEGKCFGTLLKYWFRAAPTMLLSGGCLSKKEKLTFLSACLPLGVLQRRYRRVFAHSIDFDDKNNL